MTSGGSRFVESPVVVVYNLPWRRGGDSDEEDPSAPRDDHPAEDDGRRGAGALDEGTGSSQPLPPAATGPAESAVVPPAAEGAAAAPPSSDAVAPEPKPSGAGSASAAPSFQLAISHDSLYNLFCNYGGVVRIKLLLRPPRSAVIEMADSSQVRHGCGGFVCVVAWP